jgi:DNA-binding CsgD family transcriptional regulator
MSEIVLRGGRLTPRELEVLKLIATGLSTKEIASTLAIKFKTAACHRAHIMEKLDAHGTAEITRYAAYHQLVPADMGEEARLRNLLRTSHREYMTAVTQYNAFMEERKSLGLANPDSSERTRQLYHEERRSHQAYSRELEALTKFVPGQKGKH